MNWSYCGLALSRSPLRVAVLSVALGLGVLPSLAAQTAAITVDKTVVPLTLPDPGGAFTFSVLVANTGSDTVTIAALTDNVYGDLQLLGSCSTAVGTVLTSGENYSCSFSGDFFGSSGDSQTDTVTATATPSDANQQQVQASDDAAVTLTAATAIAVDKTAEPLILTAPGGTFTFSVVVTNTGSNTVTITDLTDDVYGDLTALGSCTNAVGTVLDAGETYSCSFPGSFTGAAGDSQTDTVTATASEQQGEEEVTASDSATVTLGPARSIAVDKTVAPSSLEAPGGTFTFGVLVTNTGDVTVTIVAVDDDIYGDLTPTRPGSTCDTALGTSLAAGDTYTCSFTGDFNGAAGASQTDTVTVTALDGEDVVTGADDATVTLTQPAFAIAVDKSVLPLTRPEPGGEFTFSVVVTNTGSEQVIISALTDDVYGNLTTLPDSTCSTGTVLNSGETYSCSFTATFAGSAGDSQTDTVTATATGPEPPTLVTGADDAVVSLTDVLPAIAVDKGVSPPSLPAPGGAFTFSVVVTNTGDETVTIISLTDDIYGDLGVVMPGSTCNTAPSTVLAPGGGTYSCSFAGQFTGSAGANQTDTVTAVVRDDEDNQDSAADSATVSLTGPGSGLAEIPTLDARALALLVAALAALGIVALRRRAG